MTGVEGKVALYYWFLNFHLSKPCHRLCTVILVTFPCFGSPFALYTFPCLCNPFTFYYRFLSPTQRGPLNLITWKLVHNQHSYNLMIIRVPKLTNTLIFSYMVYMWIRLLNKVSNEMNLCIDFEPLQRMVITLFLWAVNQILFW